MTAAPTLREVDLLPVTACLFTNVFFPFPSKCLFPIYDFPYTSLLEFPLYEGNRLGVPGLDTSQQEKYPFITKLCDFGLARYLPIASSGISNLTMTATVG